MNTLYIKEDTADIGRVQGLNRVSSKKAVTCSSNNLPQLLLDLNKTMPLNSFVKLKIKVVRFNPVYLGIFYYYGFDIVSVYESSNRVRVKLKKIKEIPNSLLPKKYSFLIKLPRTGKGGKRIYVYKARSMQPYSEYLQDYVIRVNGLNDDGTIKDDFRITKIGKFLRKYWLDELPMVINFFKGDLKLIGVRPLGDSMLSIYPKEFVRYRNRFKPGLIPPYYIDQPKSFEELIESEKRYLQKYEKNPIKTDIEYFFKFLKALIIKGVRSS